MKNPIQKFKQSSIVFEKPGNLSDNLKNLTSYKYPRCQYLLLKLRTHFLLTNIYKRVFGILFYFDQILSYLKKLKIPSFYRLSFFRFLSITQDINKIKEILNTLFQTLLSRKRVQNSTKNIELYVGWSSTKLSIFQTSNLVCRK